MPNWLSIVNLRKPRFRYTEIIRYVEKCPEPINMNVFNILDFGFWTWLFSYDFGVFGRLLQVPRIQRITLT